MISKAKIFPTLLILTTLLVFASADFEDLFTNVFSVSTTPSSTAEKYRSVSLEGGAYLYIKGSGFSSRSASSNIVTLGDVTCPVIEFLTTTTQIVCQVPASSEVKSVQVKVYVDDQRIATCSKCWIYYNYYTTPQLAYLVPNAGNPGDEIFYAGRERVSTSLEVDYVKIGDYRCDPSEQNEFDSVTFGSSDPDRAPCNVPDIEAGYYNVTQKNLVNTGFAQKLNTLPVYRFNQDPYDFVVIPKIDSISNNKGSSEGQIITITGSGFSSTDQNEAYLADTECKILSQSETDIQCELQARSEAISPQGYHSGLKLEIYQEKDISSVKAGTAGTPSQVTPRFSAEIPANADDYYTSKLSGYFKAPVSGNYKFVVTADDKADLYISQTPGDKTNLQKIISVQSYTSYKFFMADLPFSQISDEIQLEANKYYYLEMYHQEYSGSDYATLGVYVPNTQNTINNVPEIQSVKINCPTDYEILEFKLSGVSGGKWRIKFDYLSSDGKKIEKTVTTSDLAYNAAGSTVSNQISSKFGLTTEIVRTMLDSTGAETTTASQAATVTYKVTFLNMRKNGKLPVIESTDLTGTDISASVTQIQASSAAVSGKFSASIGGTTVEFSTTTTTYDFESKLRSLGFVDPIKVVRSDDVDYGAEWRVQFNGQGAGPVEQLIFTSSLTGCKTGSPITVDVTTLQESSGDLFYESIPSEFLFTADDNPQITIKSNGITGSCPNFNCDYVIQNTNLPEVTSATYTSTTLTMAVSGVTTGVYSKAKLRVFFGNTECTVNTYDGSSSPASLTATCATPESGDYLPKVHFNGLGYAKTKATVAKITIEAVITAITPTEVNPNGGTVLTVTGSGFPTDIETAQERKLDVKIGSVSCVLKSVTPTSIQCINDPISADASLTVALNGKTATSSSSLTILSTVPTISSVSPNTVNPVLQTDITITGTNFDSDTANTKVYLRNATHDQIQECLPFSSPDTVLIKCKLLGAPTGSYKLYAKTSAGYTNQVSFEVKSIITSVSPSSGSSAGGTIITIQGGSFSNDVQQTFVFIGSANVACDVISSKSTEVKCRTQAKYSTYDGSAQDVVVATRIVEESVCENGATCSFAYDDSLTPVVTALDKTTVIPGGSLTITGSGFESNPSGTSPTVTIDDAKCDITSHSDTQIIVTVPSTLTPNKKAVLIVDITGKGYAKFAPASSTIQVTPSITSLSPTSGASAGVLVTILGAGFGEGVSVKFGGSACEIRSVTTTTIICKTTKAGAVTLSYKDFTDLGCSSCSSLTLSSTQKPTTTSVSPTSPTDASSFTLTIEGTLLNSNTPVIRLISQTDKTISFTGSLGSNTASQVVTSFSNIAAGTYTVEVAVGTNIASGTLTVNVPLSASVTSPVVSSIAGGATLTISGSGFFDNSQKSKNKVSVCGFPCEVTQSTASSIQCQTFTFVNSAVLSTYEDIVEPSILDGTFWSDSNKHDTVLDMTFTTNYTSTLTDCYIGLDVGASLIAELEEIKFFPNPSITSSKLSGTVIEGSNDNTTYTNVVTIDANAYDGWNTIKLDSEVRFRYFRLRGATSTAKCALAELQFFGVLLSDNTATDLNAIDCKASVTVNDQTLQTSTVAVNYKQSKTPTLDSIEPEMGTSAGGTPLTLTGSGFETTLSKIKIYIDDVECTVTSATSSEIKCTTGAAPSISNRRSSLESELKVHFEDQGYVVTNDIKYFYVDRWSEVNTWGGITPPREGESVSIPSGQTILLDTSPPKLKAIIIEGALIFEDSNIDLHCDYIIIRNGRLQIGTWENPITSKVTVTLYGNKESAQLPTYGNKVIAMMEGIIDIHGKKRSHTWTVLDSTAMEGATSIVVQGLVDWAAEEEIVIASTDHDHYQSENRKVATTTKNSAAGTTTLTFADPLKYKHYAGIQTIDGQTFEMRAEVGLLTRNVVIQGDETSKKLMYGAHMMIHSSTGDDSSIGRISYTEVRQAGQAYNLGRYPIHFHMIGNVRQSYVIGNAVHHTYNRAVTIHGVHYLKVQKNVAYWCMGHTIFIEDGIETHNVIEDNLVINTIASTALLNTDQTPASFWITNPNNIWRRNHAAGSDRYGFWFDLREHPEGPSATTSICPTGEILGEFVDNQAHSSGRYGLRIFHELTPRTYPCQPFDDYEANPPIQAEFKNFLGWKNRRSAIIGEKMGAIKFKNIKAADNHRAGIEITVGNQSPYGTLLVEDAWIVGMTPDNAGDTGQYEEKEVRGLITPRVDNFLAKNVHFSNFGNKMPAIETCSHCEHPASTDSGARTTYFEGLKFNNVLQRVRFNAPFREILIDNDGTLTDNTGKKGVVTFYYDHLDVPGCTKDDSVYNGLVCDETVTIRRVELNGLAPLDSFAMHNISIFRKEDNPSEVLGSIAYRAKTNQSWATPFVTGYSYLINWASRADFNRLGIAPSEVIDENDRTITLIFNHTEYRETYDIATTASPDTLITNTTTLWDQSSANTMALGNWHHDVTNQLLYVAVNRKEKTDLTIKAIKCRDNCPLPVTSTPKDGAIRLWSNVTQWPNQVLPKDGDNVTIPSDWLIRLDVSTAKLGTLNVNGDLYFDNTQDNLVLTAERIWVQGQMFIGNSSDDRYTNKAKIVLTGLRTSKTLMLGAVQDASNKVLAVTGNLTMYGAEVKTIYSRLLAPGKVGDTTIKVASDVDWKVGDEVLIAPSQRADNEYEVRTIQAISDGVITLNQSLAYYHFGAATTTKDTTYGTIDMRTEVGVLTRNIVVEGSNEDSWGGRIYVAEIYDTTTDFYYRGRVDIDGVEMKNFGQKDNVLAGLTFDQIVSTTNDASFVTNSVIRDSEGYELRVIGSNGITIENTIIFKGYKHQIVFEGKNTNIKFSKNLVIGSLQRSLKAATGDNALDLISSVIAYSATFVTSEISNNIFAGCKSNCVIIAGGDCSTQTEGPYTFQNNVAHSGENGWVVTSPSDKCNGITHFTGYKLDEGIATFFKSAQLKASNILITDTRIGISLNTGSIPDPTQITLKDSYIAGLALTSDTSAYFNKTECSNLAGVFIPCSTEAAKSIPPMPSALPWYKVKSNHIYEASFTVTNVVFENFKNGLVSGCTGNHVFQSNPYASDSSAHTKTSKLTLNNVGTDNRVHFEVADDGWIGIDDCGGWECTGIKNVIIRDLDGTLIGKPSSLIPVNSKVLDSKTCTVSTAENAYICQEKGWGILTFQSLDIDALTRIVSPVNITTTDGFYNTLNSYMDHVWDGFYTGLKRLSRFHSVIQSGRDYKVNFTGTVPSGLRWQLQGALEEDSITAEYGYAHPQSVQVTNKNGDVISPTAIKLGSTSVIQSSDPCGTNYYNVDTRKITIKLTGDSECRLDVKLVNSIKASIRYDLTVDQFFTQNGPTAFVDKVAAILGINPASIRIVEIRSGSTIIHFFINSQYVGSTTTELASAQTELAKMVAQLNSAVASGDLRILNSKILNSDFVVSLAITEDSDDSSSSDIEKVFKKHRTVFLIIGPILGAALVLVISYIIYARYVKKQVVVGVEDAKMMMKKSPQMQKIEGSFNLQTDSNQSAIGVLSSESPGLSPDRKPFDSEAGQEDSNRKNPYVLDDTNPRKSLFFENSGIGLLRPNSPIGEEGETKRPLSAFSPKNRNILVSISDSPDIPNNNEETSAMPKNLLSAYNDEIPTRTVHIRPSVIQEHAPFIQKSENDE